LANSFVKMLSPILESYFIFYGILRPEDASQERSISRLQEDVVKAESPQVMQDELVLKSLCERGKAVINLVLKRKLAERRQ